MMSSLYEGAIARQLFFCLLYSLLLLPVLILEAAPIAPHLRITSGVRALARTSLSIGNGTLDVELATDQSSRETGLMNRTSLQATEGMLFIFPEAKQVHFWMKKTTLPLSVAYINSHGRIIEIHDLEPLSEQLVPSSSSNILYVLEVNRGWFSEHQVLAGDIIKGLPSPCLAE